MAVPDFQTLMLPALRLYAEGETKTGPIADRLADAFNLTNEDRSELIPSGRQRRFANRVHWAKAYLTMAGLIASTGRGSAQVTNLGKQVVADPPDRITIKYLENFPGFLELRQRKTPTTDATPLTQPDDDRTPDEVMRSARDQIDQQLGQEILNRLRAAEPAFFEKVVVNLVVAMGYGGSLAKAGKALGRGGDGGVDGVIDEDPLGLDRVYVQAKRYAAGNAVGAGEIRDFFGALDQFKASKGLFVTTSHFTSSAVSTADGLSKRIVLVDGEQLVRLLVDHNVGCRVQETLFVKELDEEFFES